MATKKYLDQVGLSTLINGLKTKNDALYAAAEHVHTPDQLVYVNASMSSSATVKDALDILTANVVRNAEQMTTATSNMEAVQDAIDELKTQIGTGGVDTKINEVKDALNAFKTTQATKDGEQDTAIAAAKKAGDDAQKDVDALEGVVGTDTDTKEQTTVFGKIAKAQAAADAAQADATQALTDAETAQTTADGAVSAAAKAQGEIDALELVVGDENSGLIQRIGSLEGSSHTHTNKTELDKFVTGDKAALDNAVAKVTGDANTEGTIAEAKKAGTDAAAAVVSEKTRAEGIEQGLRTDLGNKDDVAAVDGSAFARIAQLKADLAAEVIRADTAEKANAAAAKAAQDDVDALEQKVGTVPADKTVVQMIADAKTEATYDDTALTNRVATIEGDYLKAADKTELQGNIDTVSGVANAAKEKIDAFMLAADVKEGAVDTLKEIQDYITSDGTAAQEMTQSIAANKKAIEDEVARAKAAEKVNADAIAILNGADNVEGSVAKALADAKSYADAEDKKIEDLLGTAADDKTTATAFGQIAANADAITAEVERAKAAEKANSDAITVLNGDNTVEGSVAKKIKTAIDAEAQARTDADTALDGRIDGISSRIDALTTGNDSVDSKIKAAIGDIKYPTQTVKAYIDEQVGDAKTELQGNIDNKVATSDYNAKVAELVAADNALDGRATNLETLVGKEAKDGEAATGLVKKVADNAAAIATLKGNASTEGSVDYKIAQQAATQSAKDTAQDNRLTALESKDTEILNAIGVQASGEGDSKVPASGMYAYIDNKDAALQAQIDAFGTLTDEEINTILNQVYGTTQA